MKKVYTTAFTMVSGQYDFEKNPDEIYTVKE